MLSKATTNIVTTQLLSTNLIMSPPAFPDGDEGFFNTESVIKCQDAMLLSRFCVRDTEKENQFWLRQV